MHIEWEKYKAFLIKKMPDYANKIGIPAVLYQIQELENTLNCKLPNDFWEVYSTNNGEVNLYNGKNDWGIMCGSKMLSIENILDYFFFKEDLSKEREQQIPIFKDMEEDYYIAMDLSSASREAYGQIIAFGAYRNTDAVLIAPSLTAFFKRVNDWIELGYLSYSVKLETDNEISVHDLRMYFEQECTALVSLLMGTYFNDY